MAKQKFSDIGTDLDTILNETDRAGNTRQRIHDTLEKISDVATFFPLSFWVNSDLDLVSAPRTLKGPYTIEELIIPPEISTVSYSASVDGDTYSSLADITALNTWINSNVTTDSTVWQLKVVSTFNIDEFGEVEIVLYVQY